MSTQEEKKWEKALTRIIKALDKSQFEKMLKLLVDFPKSEKKKKERDEMPQIIIQRLGLKESILTMEKILEEIPRNDTGVQELLRPFVDKLSMSPKENKKGPKRTVSQKSESDTEDEEPEAAPKKLNESKTESDEDEKKHQSDKEKAGPSCEPWRQTVQELNAIGYLKGKAIMGKVIQKSGLRPYQTQKKENKFRFFVGLADDTGATKLTVYVRELFDEIKEGHIVKLTNLLVKEQAKMVTSLTKVTKLGRNTPLTISAELEMEAKMLINHQWPVFSIAEAKNSQEKTEMTIEGTITDMKNAENQKVKGARTRKRTTELQKLTLQDDSGSITVCFWGDQVGLCRSLSVGDTISVANVRSTEFMETMSLNSTVMTQVYPVKAASVQTGRIKIIGVVQASKMKTTLEAELNQQTPTFVVESKLLAEACGFRLEGDIEEKLLDQMPFFAEVTMQGNKITTIKKM